MMGDNSIRPDLWDVPWRTGTHFPIHVYATHPDGDVPVCTALTVAFARQIVRDHNRCLESKE